MSAQRLLPTLAEEAGLSHFHLSLSPHPCLTSTFSSALLNHEVFDIVRMKALPEAFTGNAEIKSTDTVGRVGVWRGRFEIWTPQWHSPVGRESNFQGSISSAVMTASAVLLAFCPGLTGACVARSVSLAFHHQQSGLDRMEKTKSEPQFALSLEHFPSFLRLSCKMRISIPALCTCQCQRGASTMLLKIKIIIASEDTFLQV